MANIKFLKVSLIIIIINLVILNGFLAFQVVKNGQIQENKLAQNVSIQNSNSQISVQNNSQNSPQNTSNFAINSTNSTFPKILALKIVRKIVRKIVSNY